MMSDVIGGVIQMQKDQSLKDYTTEDLERELASRKKTSDTGEGTGSRPAGEK